MNTPSQTVMFLKAGVAAVLHSYRLLSDLMFSSNKIIIVGDFKIYVDAENDSFSTAFNLLLDLSDPHTILMILSNLF